MIFVIITLAVSVFGAMLVIAAVILSSRDDRDTDIAGMHELQHSHQLPERAQKEIPATLD